MLRPGVRSVSPWNINSFIGPPLNNARRGCAPPRLRRSLQVFFQPPRPQRHAYEPSGRVDTVRARTFYQIIPPISRDPRRRIGGPPAAKGGKDQRLSIAPLSGWGHRGDSRDALDWALPPVVGTGHGPLVLRPADLALLGRHSEPTTPNQPQMRIGAAQWKVFRSNDEQILAPGYACASGADWLRHNSTTPLQHHGSPQWGPYLVQSRWRLVVARENQRPHNHHWDLVRFQDDPGPIKLPLSPAHYTTSTGGVQGSSCLQLGRGKSVAREILSNLHAS